VVAITSKENKLLKTVRSLQRKKGREETGLFFIEGVRMVDEALRWADAALQSVIVSDSYAEKNQTLIHRLDESGKTVYTAKETLFRELCTTEAPQGIGAVLRIPEMEDSHAAEDSFLLILDGVSEPGNLGTIIRTAEAAGVDRVLLCKGCADLYNPKVVRATMGSLFRVPCMTGVELSTLETLKQEGFSIIATALSDSVPIAKAAVCGKRALVIGSEAFGVSKEVIALSDMRVHIPMEGEVESLNAGVAAGISMYMLKEGFYD